MKITINSYISKDWKSKDLNHWNTPLSVDFFKKKKFFESVLLWYGKQVVIECIFQADVFGRHFLSKECDIIIIRTLFHKTPCVSLRHKSVVLVYVTKSITLCPNYQNITVWLHLIKLVLCITIFFITDIMCLQNKTTAWQMKWITWLIPVSLN